VRFAPYDCPPGYAPLSLGSLAAGLIALAAHGRPTWRNLERELSRLYSPDAMLLLDSGTSALALALLATRPSYPGPTAVPAYCCFDIVTAAVGSEESLLFYDVDPLTLQPDLRSLERALRSGARKVLVTHLYGHPVDPRPLKPLLEEHDCLLIEDAAQGFGATVAGRPAGALGPLAVLSFSRAKGVTGGSGGALLGYGDKASARLESVTEAVRSGKHGWRAWVTGVSSWTLARPSTYGLPRRIPALHLGETLYREPTPPSTLSLAAAGILSRSFSLALAAVNGRRETAELLTRVLSAHNDVKVLTPAAGCRSSYLRLPTLLQGAALDRARKNGGKLGIASGYPSVLPSLSQARELTVNPTDGFPGASELVARLFTFATHERVGRRGLRLTERWVQTL
jgi:dTDP-4-amino-4,6-dideoxygalactose transaminase